MSEYEIIGDWSRSVILAIYDTGMFLGLALLALGVALWFPDQAWLRSFAAATALSTVVHLGMRAAHVRRNIAHIQKMRDERAARDEAERRVFDKEGE